MEIKLNTRVSSFGELYFGTNREEEEVNIVHESDVAKKNYELSPSTTIPSQSLIYSSDIICFV